MNLLGDSRTNPKEAERRRYDRYAVRCDCWLERDDAAVYGPTADLGLGGLFLRTAIPMHHGQRVEVALSVESAGTPVVARGVVTRTVPAQHGRRHGVGVQFLEFVDGRDSLQRFLKARPRA
ncbi:MAG: PilZ domain-containing protein [Myxococcales bacterium]|nr:PilZ domain-containing protein [Myxococcales bacterium]